MRPEKLKSKIFLDGGDPGETKEIIKLLGFLDGQTTNPTLISKNPDAQKRLDAGNKFAEKEILDFYKDVVGELSGMIPDGSISVEVYADSKTDTPHMLEQGREMFTWIPNAHIKYPTTKEGLQAAETAVKEGLRVNMTLCFNQEQAAAVYAATNGAGKGNVFVSPFVGRLDDRGENGMQLIGNIARMFKNGDGHVELLAASIRTFDHMMYALKLGSDIITAPFKILKEWGEKGLPIPDDRYKYNSGILKDIPYYNIDLSRNWKDFNIRHELTDKGIERFASDWNSLISRG